MNAAVTMGLWTGTAGHSLHAVGRQADRMNRAIRVVGQLERTISQGLKPG